MIPVVLLTVARALGAALVAISHALTHGAAWLFSADTYRYGACIDCPAPRRHAAFERRAVARRRARLAAEN